MASAIQPRAENLALVLGYQGWSVDAIVLVKLAKTPLLASEKSETIQGIFFLSQLMGLAAYKLRSVIGSVHGLALVLCPSRIH